MKIIIDSAIPFIEGIFEPFAEVVYIQGDRFTADVVRDADALIIRTRTRCNELLLKGSRVSHIATATIGYDHIDLEYCQQNSITVTTAAGCNARGVLQWVGASLLHLSKIEGWKPSQKTIGIVGVGNVGRLIEEYCKDWGFNVICCDPPRAQREGDNKFVEFEELLKSVDIVTFHTPLNKSSYHLLNSKNIGLLKPNTTIINSSRGEVIEVAALSDNNTHKLIFDVWCDEPNIDLSILRRAIISTPHIAGYTLQGKANGSSMVVNDIAYKFNIPIDSWYPSIKRNSGIKISWSDMEQSIINYLDIVAESEVLKSTPTLFERLRNNYNYRTEFF